MPGRPAEAATVAVGAVQVTRALTVWHTYMTTVGGSLTPKGGGVYHATEADGTVAVILTATP